MQLRKDEAKKIKLCFWHTGDENKSYVGGHKFFFFWKMYRDRHIIENSYNFSGSQYRDYDLELTYTAVIHFETWYMRPYVTMLRHKKETSKNILTGAVRQKPSFFFLAWDQQFQRHQRQNDPRSWVIREVSWFGEEGSEDNMEQHGGDEETPAEEDERQPHWEP